MINATHSMTSSSSQRHQKCLVPFSCFLKITALRDTFESVTTFPHLNLICQRPLYKDCQPVLQSFSSLWQYCCCCCCFGL